MDFMSYHSLIMTDDFIDPNDVLKMTKEYLQTGFRNNNARKYFKPNTLQLRSIGNTLIHLPVVSTQLNLMVFTTGLSLSNNDNRSHFNV